MKKHLLLVSLILVFVLCCSFGVLAHEAGNVTLSASDPDNPNQYTIASQFEEGYVGNDGSLWIGTLDAWTKAGGAVQGTKTILDNGEAIHGDDIILTNGKVAIVLAVGTRNPWGYPAGSVLDTGVVTCEGSDLTKAVGGRDNTWSIEPLVNGWDSWAPDNCGVVDFALAKYDFDACAEADTGIDAVKVSRIYAIGGKTFDVVTYYSIAKDADYAYFYNYYKNTGADAKVSTRFSVTNKGDDGGAMYANKVNATVGSYAKTDEAQYFVGLTMPGTVPTEAGDTVLVGKWGGSVGYKELRIDGASEESFDGKYTYAAGDSVTYPLAIVISDIPDFQNLNNYYLDYMGIEDRTTVSGTTTPGGTIIVKEDGKDYGWFMAGEDGAFSFEVPQNDKAYALFLESKGYCDSEIIAIDNSGATFDAGAIQPGEKKVDLTIKVTDQDGKAIPAKIEVYEGEDDASAYPTVRYNGESLYYTDQNKEPIAFEVEPGPYKVVVYGYGYWFYSDPVEVKGNTSDGKTALEAKVDVKLDAGKDWYAADMHHHANKNDAFSAPSDVVKSIAASGLDIYLTTDHDFTTNNFEAFGLAGAYDITGYIPSEEISCSWAHFNVVPLNEEGFDFFLDQQRENHVMNQFAQLPVFVKQTHDHNAAITANHPWYSYGLFYAYWVDAIPGGYIDDYDNIEINSSSSDAENTETLISTTALWDSYVDETAIYKDVNDADVKTAKPHYLVGGSDTHDVRYPGFAGNSGEGSYVNTRANIGENNPYAAILGYAPYSSGKIRTYTKVEGLSADVKEAGIQYGNKVVAGHSYVTYGPLLNMDKVPGTYYNTNEFKVKLEIKDLAKIKDILVLHKGDADEYEGESICKVSEEVDYIPDGVLTYDKALSKLGVNASAVDAPYTFEFSAPVADKEETWFAFVVVDENDNFAITNPYWVSNIFPDAQNTKKFYNSALAWAAKNNIVNGMPDGSFAADNTCTRGQIVTMLYRAAGEPEVDTSVKCPFTDVKKGAFYYNAMLWAVDKGITTGMTKTTFEPNTVCNRGQIVTFMHRAAGKPEVTAENPFSDVPKGAFYEKAVLWAVDEGITSGVTKTTFEPKSACTRGHAVTFIFRAMTE